MPPLTRWGQSWGVCTPRSSGFGRVMPGPCPILVPPPSPSNTPVHTEFVAEGPAFALASDDSCHPGSLINVMQSVRVPGSSKHPAPSAQPGTPRPRAGCESLRGPCPHRVSVYLFASCVSLRKHQFCVDGDLLDSLFVFPRPQAVLT